MAKSNDTLYIVLGAAALGYLAYKRGLFNKPAAPAPIPLPGSTQGGIQSAQSVALETPSFADIGIIAPKQIDITGEQLAFY